MSKNAEAVDSPKIFVLNYLACPLFKLYGISYFIFLIWWMVDWWWACFLVSFHHFLGSLVVYLCSLPIFQPSFSAIVQFYR